MINKRKYIYQNLLLGIILLLLFITARFFYNRLYFGEYKYAHKDVYTYYDYFMEMKEDDVISESNFRQYMYSAYNTMVGSRDVTIDRRILENGIQRTYCLYPIKYSQDNIGVLNGLFDEKELDCQKYYLLDTDGKEHKLFIFTGNEWEKSSHIKIFCDLEGNIIIAPEELFGEKDFADVEIQVETFSCEKVLMQAKKDATIERIVEENHKKEIVIRQLIFIFFVASIGFIVEKPILAKVGTMAIWFILPLGFFNQIFSTFLLIVSHLKISLLNYILISYSVAILLNIYIRRYADNDKISIKCSKKQIISFLLWISVIVWFCVRPHIILSYDSVLNAYFGKHAAVTGDLNAVLDELSSYSLITPLYEVGSALFGIELNYSIQPILTITFMAAIGWIWFTIIRKPVKIKIGIILWVVLFLITNPMFYIQTFWKLNNLSLGLFLGFTVGMHLLYYLTEEKIYFEIGNLFSAVVGVARIEGGLFIVIHMVCLYILFQSKNREKEIENLCLKIALLLTAVYFYFLCIIGQIESEFWTPQKGLAMNILIWVVYFFFRMVPVMEKKIKKIVDNIDIVMLLCIFLAILIFGITNGEKFIHNMFAYTVNLGNYGGYWPLVIIVAVCGIFYLKKNPIIRFLSVYVVSYFLLIPGLMIFRETPLRIGFGDSACRMLSHIAVVGGYLLIYFVDGLFTDKRTTIQNGEEKNCSVPKRR